LAKNIIWFMLTALFCSFQNEVHENFVANGSFEKFTSCPVAYGDIGKASGWLKTSVGNTPDYFNRCNRPDKNGQFLFGVPYNYEGRRESNSGEAYIGMGLFFNTNFYYRE